MPRWRILLPPPASDDGRVFQHRVDQAHDRGSEPLPIVSVILTQQASLNEALGVRWVQHDLNALHPRVISGRQIDTQVVVGDSERVGRQIQTAMRGIGSEADLIGSIRAFPAPTQPGLSRPTRKPALSLALHEHVG